MNYYEITSCAEFAYITNAATGNWNSFNYILKNDLILNDTILTWDENGDLQNDPETLHAWKPLYYEFTGIFDGGGHTISGAYVDTGDDCASLFAYGKGTVKSLNVVNASISGARFCGGIIGEAPSGSSSFSDLVFSGVVKGTEKTGGIIGECHSSGGIANCVNYGDVFGSKGYIGGISGRSYSDFINCSNYGAVTSAGGNTGGIVGRGQYGSCTACCNHGAVSGTGSIGGIIGWASDLPIKSCFNPAPVSGVYFNVGGIVGLLENSMSIVDCYDTGAITCTGDGNKGGAIVGTNGAVWGKDTIIGCYYLKTDTVNSEIYGCYGVDSPEMEPDGFYAKSENEMKAQSTYAGWDFIHTWRMDPNLNDGYPYLAWQDGSDIPWDEYIIGPLTVRDDSGDPLTAIPTGPFLVTVPVTKQTEGGDAVVLLVSYTAAGQNRGLMYVAIKNATEEATVEVTLPVDNDKGDIAVLKAFAIPSFGNPMPLGPASVFPAAQ